MKHVCIGKLFWVVALLSLVTASLAWGADWPAYRHDAARSGVAAEALQAPLHLQWTHRPAHPPRPAWPEPGRELHRIAFDYAYQVSVANGLAYFGSSADHKVYAIDLATGAERWSFFTEGPVRFAPTVDGSRLFVASDDGCLYCLDAGDGALVWRFRAGPRDEKMIGNEQMISRWPLRTGVAVEDGIIYFAAGMWPTEGVYVYALKAEDGAVIWKNDTSNAMYLRQPHSPSEGITGVVPQGEVVLSERELFIPTGRNVPAAYDKKTGELLYYHARPNTWGNRWGGVRNFTVDGLLFAWRNHIGPDIDVRVGEGDPWKDDGLAVFDCRTGKIKYELAGPIYAAVSDGVLYTAGAADVTAYDLAGLLSGVKPGECTRWRTSHARAYSLVVAGDAVLVGGKEVVTALSTDKGALLWKGAVAGQSRGLAVADGRVLVSSNTGEIACFGPNAVADPPTISRSARADEANPQATETAAKILSETGVTEGYCLLLGASDGDLARALAEQSELTVFCAEPDGERAGAARRALDAAGLYGVRVVVHQAPLDGSSYPQLFADLLVKTSEAGRDPRKHSPEELVRVLRPLGGTAYVAPMRSGPAGAAARISTRLEEAGVSDVEVSASDSAVTLVRGALPGAGKWTHQYADTARTGCSDDERVKLPLKLLWFGKPGPSMMVARHWGGPAPLSVNGRLFVIGQFKITAVDAYNGRQLWSHEFVKQGKFAAGRFHVGGTGGNSVADADSIYVATATGCVRLDAATGEIVREYALPSPPAWMSEKDRQSLGWGYIAVSGDLLLGTMGHLPENRYVTSGKCLFALGKDDGELRWSYETKKSIHHDAIAIGEGVVYLVDKPGGATIERWKRRGVSPSVKTMLVALRLATGEEIWTTDKGLNDRRDLRIGGDVLVATGGGRMTAYRTSNGRMLSWSGAPMRRFPVIVGDIVYGEPYAYDLRTGKRLTREHPLTGEQTPWRMARSYGCGSISAAPDMLLFRSGTLGIYDLACDSGIRNIGGVRAGCYVNAIVANGLVLMPPSDATCTCSYNYQTTVALVPTTEDRQEWSVFSAPGAPKGAKVRQLAVNLGAPGDMRDADGKLWLSFPRHAGFGVPLKVELAEGGADYRRNPESVSIQGTDMPSLYLSGSNLLSATVDLNTEAAETYRVRLHFAELEDIEPGGRVFDVKIQGELVLKGLDVVSEVGGPGRALVKEFTGIEAGKALTLELEATTPAPPIISAIELRAE